jgi:hypothetical protein
VRITCAVQHGEFANKHETCLFPTGANPAGSMRWNFSISPTGALAVDQRDRAQPGTMSGPMVRVAR